MTKLFFFLHPVLLKSANNPSNEEVKLFRLMKRCLLRTYSGLNCLWSELYVPLPEERIYSRRRGKKKMKKNCPKRHSPCNSMFLLLCFFYPFLFFFPYASAVPGWVYRELCRFDQRPQCSTVFKRLNVITMLYQQLLKLNVDEPWSFDSNLYDHQSFEPRALAGLDCVRNDNCDSSAWAARNEAAHWICIYGFLLALQQEGS